MTFKIILFFADLSIIHKKKKLNYELRMKINYFGYTLVSMCPLTIKLPMINITVPPINNNAAKVIAFHGIFTGGLVNY